jgi:hypothetical protein
MRAVVALFSTICRNLRLFELETGLKVKEMPVGVKFPLGQRMALQ